MITVTHPENPENLKNQASNLFSALDSLNSEIGNYLTESDCLAVDRAVHILQEFSNRSELTLDPKAKKQLLEG